MKRSASASWRVVRSYSSRSESGTFARAEEGELPLLGMVHVGEAAGRERADEVERHRRVAVGDEHVVGVGPAAARR